VTRVLASVGAATSYVRGALRSWLRRWAEAIQPLREPELFGTRPTAARAASALGVSAFAIGLLLAAAIAVAEGAPPRFALARTIQELLWAGGRFTILALLVRRSALPRASLATAFLAGLVPYAIGVTAGVRIAALLASWLLTVRALRGAGLESSVRRRACGWAFGGHLGTLAAGWLLRGALAVVAVV
jgi:hypothetical protein